MWAINTFALSLGFLLSSAVGVAAAEFPMSLACRSNAKASRDYAFRESRWEGQKDASTLWISRLFRVETRKSKVADSFYALRDKVFSGLNTSTPLVRSITRFPDGTDKAEEFTAKVVSRTSDALFLIWTNELNKTWVGGLDLTHRKAVVAEVFQGVTSVGGEIETLDCQ